MNQQILDAPFEDEFDFLNEGETILWKGQNRTAHSKINIFSPVIIFEPFFKLEIDTQIFISSTLIILATWGIATKPESLPILPILSIAILSFLVLSVILNKFYFRINEKIQYYITEERLIFQFDKSGFHSINIDNIKGYFLKNPRNLKIILLEVKNHPASKMLSSQFINGENKTVCKIENIKNAGEFFRLLRLSNKNF